MKASQETYENVVATLVDIGSMMVSYQIGLAQLNFAVGMVYAGLDAMLVVWLRRPITLGIRRLLGTGKTERERIAMSFG